MVVALHILAESMDKQKQSNRCRGRLTHYHCKRTWG
jgi:hypothetical protein